MRALATWQDKCIDSQLLVASIVGLFKLRGLDSDKLLRGTGIFAADIRKPDHLISPKQLSRLLDNALCLWPSGDLSFLLGQLWLPSQSGALTAGIFCARDLKSLGHFWHKYHWLTQPWLQTWRWQGEQEWHFLLSLDLGMQRHKQFFIELSLSSLTACCKQLLGQAWRGSISFPYPAPANLAHYYKYFGTELSFDAPLCRISMAKSLLCQPLLFASHSETDAIDFAGSKYTKPPNKPAALQPWEHPHASTLDRHFNEPLASTVLGPQLTMAKNARQALLAHGFRHGLAAGIRLKLMHNTLSLPEMAQLLEMSPATLKRRLGEMGLSYGQLVDESRLIKALYFLAEPEQDANSIAHSLSFSDASNFRRSFKRWTGQLPAYFRFWLA